MSLTLTSSLLIALPAAIAASAAWWLRGRRASLEREALDAGWEQQLDSLQTANERMTELNRRLHEQLNNAQIEVAQQRSQIAERDATLEAAANVHDRRLAEVEDLKHRLDVATAERDLLRQERWQESQNDSAQVTLAARDAEISRLRQELKSWQARLPPLTSRYRECERDAREARAALEQARAELAEVRAELAAATSHTDDGRARTIAVSGASPNREAADDLTRIRGIGPAIEKTLHELGYRRFHQLAQLSEADIERIGAELRGFRSRIERDDWQGQAAQFAGDAV